MRTFRVERMVLGMIRTNCYLLIREDTGETLIVDPATGQTESRRSLQKSI